MNGLQNSSGWKRYSKEVKTAAVLDYLSGNYSMSEIVRKYEMSSKSVLEKWIKNYNNHRELKATQRMNNEERIQREMQRLERENERLRAENAFLKKLEELERRRLEKRP